MSRSEAISDHQAGLVTRLLFWFAKCTLGSRVPRGVRVRAFDPKYLRRAVRMDLYAVAPGTVPMHLKELAQLKVALPASIMCVLAAIVKKSSAALASPGKAAS